MCGMICSLGLSRKQGQTLKTVVYHNEQDAPTKKKRSPGRQILSGLSLTLSGPYIQYSTVLVPYHALPLWNRTWMTNYDKLYFNLNFKNNNNKVRKNYSWWVSPLVLDHSWPRFARCCLLPYPKKLKTLWQDFQQCPPPFSAWKRWQDHNQLVQNHMTRLIVAHCGFLSGKMLVAVWLVCSRSTGDFSLLDRGSALVTCLNPFNL